jgi:hypothetical protein
MLVAIVENPTVANSCSWNKTTDHSVLSHQDYALSTKGDTNLVHLLGADIVNTNDEDRLVVLKETLELLVVSGFGCVLAPHVF